MSKERLSARAGFQLGKFQAGLEPEGWEQDKRIAEARYRAIVNARKGKP